MTDNMDMAAIRAGNLALLSSKGFHGYPSLPLLEDLTPTKTLRDVCSRALAINAVIASSYAFPKTKAIAWLETEGLMDSLTPSEVDFLRHDKGSPHSFHFQVEALWALTWVASITVDLLDFTHCSNDLAYTLPNLKTAQSADAFRQRSRLRYKAELLEKWDLLYCMHWSRVHADINKLKHPAPDRYIVEQRRRALEWVFSDEDWDNVSLDT